jgi:hypothetical protein
MDIRGSPTKDPVNRKEKTTMSETCVDALQLMIETHYLEREHKTGGETFTDIRELLIEIEQLEAKIAPGGETVLPLAHGGRR